MGGSLFNQAANPNNSGRYFIVHYLGAAGTRGYPRGGVGSRPSHYNPFAPAIPDPPAAPPSYTALSDGVFLQNRQLNLGEIVDGTSNTLLLGERQYFDPAFDAELPTDRIRDWGWGWFGAQGDAFLGTSVRINYRLPPGWTTGAFGNPQLLFEDRINAYGSMHPGGCQVALTDGSVRFIAETISPITFRALGTRVGGEPIGDF